VVVKYIIGNSILKFRQILTFFNIFLNLFCLVDFFEYFKFELHLYGIMQCSVLKNIIHVIWCMLSPEAPLVNQELKCDTILVLGG